MTSQHTKTVQLLTQVLPLTVKISYKLPRKTAAFFQDSGCKDFPTSPQKAK